MRAVVFGEALNAASAALLSPLDSLLKINRNNRPRGRRRGCARYSVRGIDLRARFKESQTRFARVNCNCWDCSYCGPIKQKRYRKAIGSQAETLGLKRFVTLTLNPSRFLPGLSYADFRELHDEEEEKTRLKKLALVYLRDCFNKLRVYLGRKYGRGLRYICVTELHQSGMPHLHLLVDRYIPIVWIREVWQSVGGGHQVRIEAVAVRSGAAYISKYLAKQMQSRVPARCRRVTTSRNITLLPKRPGPKHYAWEFQKHTIWTALDYLEMSLEEGRMRLVQAMFDRESILVGFAVRDDD